MSWLTIGIILYSLTCICYSENDTFTPTKEWQEIKPGQGVPAGLHIRINLETGMKEAKLLDKNNEEDSEIKSSSSLSVTIPEENTDTETNPSDKKKVKLNKILSDALKTLPKGTLGIDFNSEKFEKIKKDYKSYDELKRSLKEMNMNFKSDAEIISELIKDFQNVTKEETKIADVVRILDNFNYLVHQIDNAIWFIEENGLDLVLLPNIVNNTNTALRVQSMRVLGALTQNNPKAQISVYEKNFGSYLSQILISSASTDELSTALYAFGSLLRKFPHAQKNILSRSGIRSLITVLSKDCEIKIKAKALTLISDLIVEKHLAVANAASQDASQYFDLNFEEWLTSNEFCQTVDGAISQKMYDLIDQPDITEYFVQSLDITAHICQRVWSQSAQLRHTLLTIKNRYIHTNEEYRLEVAKLIEQLTRLLFRSPVEIKDEL
ncbi:nucleotide exchange factor Sil1 [Episyrphus balteatus]|uniref:nucleotide exchange factor Sil1 n=1 Tax=Episyrphus balteatus TaxID=286459 RepID=UPI002486C158|nr:nucleotide exchange factor Sil1 [Episyrphus balteatus]